MNKTVTITIPHKLTVDEVKSRLNNGIADARRNFAAQIGTVQETWNGDRMDFRLAAMGQQVTGRVDVQPSELRFEIDLPFMLAMLADRLRGAVEEHGRKLLEKK
jgi:hypothetical protein